MPQFDFFQSSCEADFDQPLFDHLRALQSGKAVPPYIPHCPLKPLHQLAHLALLWKEGGFAKEAGQLAHWLLPLKNYPSLWSTEKEFNGKRSRESFERLASMEPIPGWTPDFTYQLFATPLFNGVFAGAGRATTLGVLESRGVEIRAFGPQSPSLAFGIHGKKVDHWVPTFAYPELWLEFRPELTEKGCSLSCRFVGITAETPLSFTFYVKAPLCQVGPEILKPQALRRFVGEGSEVKLGPLTIESSQTQKIEVTPLAGAGCYWDCDFMISFEVHPLNPQITFTFL